MESLTAYTDEQLIVFYKEKDDAVYVGELYKRYSTLVYGLSYKYFKNDADAQEAVSDIFEHLFEKLKTQEISFFKSWLYTLSKNRLLRKIEQNNLMKINELENNSERFMENDTSVYLNNAEEKNELLQKALSNLNEEQRTCIELFYYQRKTYQEVASITGYDLNKVKSAIQNGKRNLKIFMEEKQQ
ncbi:MAG: sigma-70 family RNA polymerase sigma factor [Chitinophagales bacterium]